ncbi:protein kinase domain-containing protein [Ditylenchus destructor]|uniref:Protein kinase domain-containing protein n=1 Tax=Ditylenchus destructor TaxID=166010 RepID=A0AAD4N4Y1_9BILA|nr:protein kinase domain-containing protein [Ditylenchus destructor]
MVDCIKTIENIATDDYSVNVVCSLKDMKLTKEPVRNSNNPTGDLYLPKNVHQEDTHTEEAETDDDDTLDEAVIPPNRGSWSSTSECGDLPRVECTDEREPLVRAPSKRGSRFWKLRRQETIEATRRAGSESRSDSPRVDYNLCLSRSPMPANEPPPPTPSVADIVFLKFHLSPEIVEERTSKSPTIVSHSAFDFSLPPSPNPAVAGNETAEPENKNSTNGESEENDLTPLKYHLVPLCTIGTGTFGRVQLARHRKTGHYYALKSMHIPSIISKHQQEHVFQEKRILEQINHPFIVKMYDTAKDKSHLYMIMEFLSGGELFSYLRVSKNFSSTIVKFYTAEIVLALEYLHSMSIAYRDLKLENLMLTHEGHVKITDFGFAKRIDNKSYTLCGTPSYLAPEIASRRGHNQMVDWWALGVLIFELMAGFPPFEGISVDDVLDSIRDAEEQSQEQGTLFLDFPRKTFSSNVKDLVQKLLIIDPSKRLCSKSGASEIKEHDWFKNCDWQLVRDKALQPPLIPTIYHDGDTGNFDSYDEAEEQQPTPQRQLDLFDDW